MTEYRSQRFLAAFNEIENHFKSRLGDRETGFMQLARQYRDKSGLRRQEMDALQGYAELRNLLVHGRYQGGAPMAEPSAGTLAAIERLRDQIIRPPTALSVLPNRNVCLFESDEPVSAVLEAVLAYEFSQFPVFEGGKYCGLLTTNCIARWLADRFGNIELAEAEPIRDVLRFAELSDHAEHLPRTVTARDAIRRLGRPSSGGVAPRALIITQNGNPGEKPLAIVVADDLLSLFGALG